MRGGSQSRLVETELHSFFVAKFLGNPQGSRTLINEVICAAIMHKLNINTPQLALLDLPDDVRSSAFFQSPTSRKSVPRGQHLGSTCPVNPNKLAIFDFLPRKLLSKVTNLRDFGTAFVVDRWLHQTDSRQAIFVRDRHSDTDLRFRAHLIDHGFALGGVAWALEESPLCGLYYEKDVYLLIDLRTLCKDAVSRIENLTEAEILETATEIPETWFLKGEREQLEHLLQSLAYQRRNLKNMIARHTELLFDQKGKGQPA